MTRRSRSESRIGRGSIASERGKDKGLPTFALRHSDRAVGLVSHLEVREILSARTPVAGLTTRYPPARSALGHPRVMYKVDRVSRSLIDFARQMEAFDRHRVSFVSVARQFNAATSMSRLLLDAPLSFASFERGTIGERTRDRMAAKRRLEMFAGGYRPSGTTPTGPRAIWR
jgi:Resolvase, N terminal domain